MDKPLQTYGLSSEERNVQYLTYQEVLFDMGQYTNCVMHEYKCAFSVVAKLVGSRSIAIELNKSP